ncbi:zinc-ribbon domain-containing protein [Puniceibacterium sp. IMCC21224]|uniref:zinc-ribbon domain-containing protein n=1 Tax=Puniceibacterium sp. IMCC21224 TaxID=1618204 RepID=UPI00064DA8EB|nr:zinc-ribbon domain-containing protein [Puniceibacterium sp. IMCC21224]KMK66471.1 zinc-ribbon domain [Puniceibacterium sp. IMCC21224]
MRLICPNCGAQYEVPKDVVPLGGRDVQCSNCGNTWFQVHPDSNPVSLDKPDQPEVSEPPQDIIAPPPEPEAVPDPAPPPTATFPAAATSLRQRGLDPSVADVLRQEAERESRHRASEATALESQPELGLDAPEIDEAVRRSREARERMARMRDATPPTPQAEPDVATAVAATMAASGSRRGQLPDIDEINQTLRSSSERLEVETAQGRAELYEEDEPGGFGRGFASVLMLAVFAIALYAFAPRLSEMAPGLEPALTSYVGFVDSARGWLDGQITALLSGLDDLSSEATPTDSGS